MGTLDACISFEVDKVFKTKVRLSVKLGFDLGLFVSTET